jgi:uncharacterized membrane protein YgcG
LQREDESQGHRLARRGQRFDIGVLFLVFAEDRAMRVEVGYGLEGSLTDATSITNAVVKPLFRKGAYTFAGRDRPTRPPPSRGRRSPPVC